MPICGFCKNEVNLEDLVGSQLPKRDKVQMRARYTLFYCPHCQAILNITYRG